MHSVRVGYLLRSGGLWLWTRYISLSIY